MLEPVLRYNQIMDDVVRTVGVLLLNDKDQVLLVRHTEKAEHITGVYGVPAGRIEPGETDEEAAVREAKEETDLDIRKESLVPLPKEYVARIERDGAPSGVFSIQVFLCESFSGEPKETDEAVPEWVDIDKLNNYTLLPNVENFVKDGLELISS